MLSFEIGMEADRRYRVKAAKYDEQVLRMNPELDAMLREEARGEAIASAQTYKVSGFMESAKREFLKEKSHKSE